jgi:CheY-like chemotaxis protein
VLGLCDLLSHTALNAEQHDYVVNIQKSSSILFNVINQILDFSKSEASVIGVNEVRFSPRSKIEDIMMMMSSHAEANKLKMNFYLPACFDKEVIGDNVKLEQIMINLLGNAIKFTKKYVTTSQCDGTYARRSGSVTLQGELVRSDITEQEWKIEVVDTGIGVDEASSSKLFQPFTQLDGSSSRKYGGTGLGLAISKLLVEKLGGQIGHCNVKQNGNVIGSNFWFTFKTKPVPFHDIEPARFMVPAEMCLALNMKENCHTSVLKRYLNEWGATIVNTNDNRRCATIITKKMYSAMSDEELNKDTFIVLTSHPKVIQTTKANIYFAQIPYVVSNLKMVLFSAFNKAPVQSVQRESDNNWKQEPSEKTDKILVVEDNVMNRKVIVKLLEKEGNE